MAELWYLETDLSTILKDNPGPAQGLGKLGLGLRPHQKKKIP